MTQQLISTFIDGELPDDQLDIVLAALRQPEGRATWDDYYQVSDALHSEDLTYAFSADFSARMAEKLAAEPTVIGSAALQKTQSVILAVKPNNRLIKRFAMPGMAAAAVAAVAFFAAPPLMVAFNGANSVVGATMLNASLSKDVTQRTTLAAAQSGVILRDAGIDDYLLAHQRFSPSVYSTAQYARSATFATDSEK